MKKLLETLYLLFIYPAVFVGTLIAGLHWVFSLNLPNPFSLLKLPLGAIVGFGCLWVSMLFLEQIDKLFEEGE